MRTKLLIMLAYIMVSAMGFSDSLNVGPIEAHGLVQAWATNDTSIPSQWFNFRIRHAELFLGGSLGEKARWFISVDPAKRINLSTTGTLTSTSDNSILDDAGAAYRLMDGLELIVGQFRIPTIAEGLAADGELSMPERSLIARTFGDRREPGLMVSGKWDKVSLKVMGSNGRGPNVDDNNSSKDLNLRVSYDFSAGNIIGVFASLQNFSFRHHSLWGVDYHLHLQDFSFRIEGGMNNTFGILGYGGVSEVSYSLTSKWQPVLRGEYYRPQSRVDGAADSESLGLNYYLSGNDAKIQASASSISGMQGVVGTTQLSIGKPRATLLMLSFIVQK